MPAATVAGSRNGKAAAPAIVVPFARASNQYAEQFFQFTGLTLGAAAAEQQPQNILPGGFIRGIWLVVANTANGALGTGTVGQQFPFSMIQSVTLEDINGAPIIGPLTGYELYLANKYFGYFFAGDAAMATSFVGTIVAPAFALWLPCEINSDGLGSLLNTDARAQYRVRITTNSLAGAMQTVGTATTPTFTITGIVETWSQVEATNLQGFPQEQLPPAPGTTQFIVHENFVVAASQSIVQKHNRVGNLIRNWLYFFTNNTPPGVDSLTDPIRIRLDNRYLRVEPVSVRFANMARRYGLTIANGATQNTPQRDTGVYVYPRSGDATYHPSPADDGNWLATTEASFLALEDTLAATAVANLMILTNDVAPRGDIPSLSEL